jgi:hypothetical protein
MTGPFLKALKFQADFATFEGARGHGDLGTSHRLQRLVSMSDEFGQHPYCVGDEWKDICRLGDNDRGNTDEGCVNKLGRSLSDPDRKLNPEIPQAPC